MWTPPHFWALALYRCRDYERVGVPMLPVVAGPDETRRQILIYSLLLVPLAVVPCFIGLGGITYAVASAVARRRVPLARRAGLRACARAARPMRRRSSCSAFSILYLFALFAVLLVEHTVRIAMGA